MQNELYKLLEQAKNRNNNYQNVLNYMKSVANDKNNIFGFSKSEMQNKIKIAEARINIGNELINYLYNTFEEFESMWFENTEKDFVSKYATQNNIAGYTFDENLEIEIVE